MNITLVLSIALMLLVYLDQLKVYHLCLFTIYYLQLTFSFIYQDFS